MIGFIIHRPRHGWCCGLQPHAASIAVNAMFSYFARAWLIRDFQGNGEVKDVTMIGVALAGTIWFHDCITCSR